MDVATGNLIRCHPACCTTFRASYKEPLMGCCMRESTKSLVIKVKVLIIGYSENRNESSGGLKRMYGS